MPTWGNTDAPASKPKFDVERQTRETVQAVTANSTISGANVIVFVANVQALGVTTGQYVYAANVAANGYAGFFTSNNTVAAVSGNTVTLTNNTSGIVPSGATVEFDKTITWRTNNVANTYNQDTVLITASRLARAIFNPSKICAFSSAFFKSNLVLLTITSFLCSR